MHIIKLLLEISLKMFKIHKKREVGEESSEEWLSQQHATKKLLKWTLKDAGDLRKHAWWLHDRISRRVGRATRATIDIQLRRSRVPLLCRHISWEYLLRRLKVSRRLARFPHFWTIGALLSQEASLGLLRSESWFWKFSIEPKPWNLLKTSYKTSKSYVTNILSVICYVTNILSANFCSALQRNSTPTRFKLIYWLGS